MLAFTSERGVQEDGIFIVVPQALYQEGCFSKIAIWFLPNEAVGRGEIKWPAIG